MVICPAKSVCNVSIHVQSDFARFIGLSDRMSLNCSFQPSYYLNFTVSSPLRTIQHWGCYKFDPRCNQGQIKTPRRLLQTEVGLPHVAPHAAGCMPSYCDSISSQWHSTSQENEERFPPPPHMLGIVGHWVYAVTKCLLRTCTIPCTSLTFYDKS